MNQMFGTMIANPLVWNPNNFKYFYPKMFKEFSWRTKIMRDFLAESIEKRRQVLKEGSADDQSDKQRVVCENSTIKFSQH